MTTRLFLSACITGLLLGLSAPAAPAPADTKNVKAPNVTVQAKSIDELVEVVKSTMKKLLPDFAYAEFEKSLLTEFPDKIKGIDRKKPFGLYATLGAGLLQGDLSKTSVVILVPVNNEKDFVALLERLRDSANANMGNAGLKIEKKDDGYSIAIPDAPVEGFMQFLKGHAYISFAAEKLNPRAFLDPKELFDEKETAAATLRIRIDRLPDDLKSGSLALLAQATDAAKNSSVPAPWSQFVEDVLRIGCRWSKMGLEEGKELVYRINLDQNTGAFVQETTLEAKTGTALAKSFDFKPTKNDFAGIVGPDSAAHLLIQTPLFIDDVKTTLSKLIVVGSAEVNRQMKGDAPQEALDGFTEFFKTLRRTVDDGNLDLAASLRGPDKNDQFTAVGAFTLKDTAALEKSLKAMIKVLPKDAAQMFKVDVFTVEGINVHEIAVGELLPAEAQKIFSKSSVYVALAPSAVFATFGAQAKSMMKDVLTQKLTPKPAPLVHMEFSGKRIMQLWKHAGAPQQVLDYFGKFADVEHFPLFGVKVEGGNNKLVVRQEFGLLSFFSSFGFAMAAPAQAPPPVVMPVQPPAKAAPKVEVKPAPPKEKKNEDKKENKKGDQKEEKKEDKKEK